MSSQTFYSLTNTKFFDSKSGLEFSGIELASLPPTADISEISTALVVKEGATGIECNALDKTFQFKTRKNFQYLYVSLPATVFLPNDKKPRFDIHSFFTQGQHQHKVAQIEHFDHASEAWVVHRQTYNPLKDKVSLIRIMFAMPGDVTTALFPFDISVRDRTPGGGVGVIDCDPQAGNDPP